MQIEAESDLDAFWSREAQKVNWFEKWSSVFSWDPPKFRWFEGGKTNLSYNCLDLQEKKGRGGHLALIATGENGERRTFTYSELLVEVKRIAAALRSLGVRKGDRVAIYMPAVPEAIATMLATTRIGAMHVVIFAGFGSDALADRIQASGAKLLISSARTSRRGKEVDLASIVKKAAANPHSPLEHVVILADNGSGTQAGDEKELAWGEFLDRGKGLSSLTR